LRHIIAGWSALAPQRLVEGTPRGCEHDGCPAKFDEALRRRWARAIAVEYAPGA